MKSSLRLLSGCVILLLNVGYLRAQTPAAPQTPAPQTPAAQVPAAKAPAATSLKLYSLGSETQADPFPPVDPKFFTADAPSVATVNSYLKTMVGFDPNRIWRVAAIQKTQAAGVSKVVVLIAEKGPNAKVQKAQFFVLPDGKHIISSDATGVSPFGSDPFADNRALLQARSDGPAHGSASKDLLLVEFADLQCPHCKDAQATMTRLAQDFPKARIVYENFPLTDVHPFAFQAAAIGDCIARQSPEAYFTYAQAVYATQGALLPDTGAQTLKDAVTKAGMDPAAISTCAASPTAKANVEAQMKLGVDIGVDSTPTLVINGRPLSIAGIPYDTLKALIVYQAELDGVSAAAGSPEGSSFNLKPR